MRQLVLLRARLSSSDLPKILDDEMDINTSLIQVHPASESLWIHRKFLFDMSCHGTTTSMTTTDEWQFAARFYEGDTVSEEALKYALWIAFRTRARPEMSEGRDVCRAKEAARELVRRCPFHAKLYKHIENVLAAANHPSLPAVANTLRWNTRKKEAAMRNVRCGNA